ncbi:MAG: hypothetical protein A2Z04_06655 [Chloroflexi bacterium RBG_16_57_9]|nr:MAG: hypothetical protein A2Z04_06655 [Chloroflexi bacterium RBG_16_57_9]
MRILAWALLILLVAACRPTTVELPMLVGTEREVMPAADYDFTQERLFAFERINALRFERGLPLLRHDPLAALAAQRYTQAAGEYIALTGICAHGDRDGKRSWAWYEDLGGDFSWAGENGACGIVGAVEVVNAWMTSSGHAALILDPQAEVLELGRWSANGWPVWFALFLKDASGPPPAPVSTPTIKPVPTLTLVPVPRPSGTPTVLSTPAVIIIGGVGDAQLRELCARRDVVCIQR